MTIPTFSAARRLLAWCLLTSVGLASVEALGYLAQTGERALSLAAFAQCWSNAAFAYMLTLVVLWCVLWCFLVWLGGVRRGMALFFTLLFLTFFVLLTDGVDLFFKEFMAKAWRSRAYVVVVFGMYSLVAATLVSLVTGKVLRRLTLSYPNPRGFAVFVVLLVESMAAVWANGAALPYCQGTVAWVIFAAIGVVTIPVVWWFGKAPLRLGLLVLLACSVVFAPLTWIFAHPVPPPVTTPAATSPHPVKHVVLITIDTLRKDALGCYSPGQANTPHIDRLAQDGTLFANAFSSAPWTMPSVASMMTGVSPRVHQLLNAPNVLPDNLPTIAEYLHNAGYRTGAVGYNSILESWTKLDRGFQDYHWFPQPRIAAKSFDFGLAQWLWATTTISSVSTAMLTDEAIAWIKANAQQDSFFWVHYFDPHLPYSPPKAFAPADPKQIAMGNQFSDKPGVRAGNSVCKTDERAWVRALYDGEVRYVDAEVGRLFDTLRELGIYEEALIVLTSDHGEEFWEHDGFEHGHTLFNELLHVPLVVKLPGEHRGVTAEPYVGLQALLPTVLDLCGIVSDHAQVLAPPLTPLLRDPQAAFEEKPILSGSVLHFDARDSVIFDHMKYIRSEVPGHELLFNLGQDPQERTSLVSLDPANLAKGRQLLDSAGDLDKLLKEQLGVGQGKSVPLNQQSVIELKALGYF